MRISRSRRNKPVLGITLGDPGGIGPEVTIKALASHKVKGLANFLLIGTGWVIEKQIKDSAKKIDAKIVDIGEISKKGFKKGKAADANAKASLQYIDKAIELASKRIIDGIVTAPVNKESINRAGFYFPGHTEYLAHAFGVKHFVMLLIGGGLKVAPVTRHIAIKDVPKRLKTRDIASTIIIVDKYLKRFFKVKNPKIGVCGLNPHAGDGGLFGDEEQKIISPAINSCKNKKISVYGPIAADSIYFEALKGGFDAVISMYHDQGLIPVKTLSRNEGVNATLGLPIPRTSPDHGTAFDIADRNIADPGSMISAIRLCAKMALRR